MRHDKAAGNVRLAWLMEITVSSSKDILEVSGIFPPPDTRPNFTGHKYTYQTLNTASSAS